jgi:hypothetical protein
MGTIRTIPPDAGESNVNYLTLFPRHPDRKYTTASHIMEVGNKILAMLLLSYFGF